MFGRTTTSPGLASTVLVALMAGCSSSRVVTNQDPNADFSAFGTYDFVAEPGTDTEQYGSLLTEFLRAAVSRELEARGYERSEEPDLLVNFYVYTKEKIQSTQTPTGYYQYRRRYGGYAGYETTVSQYTEGTLNVDLIDRRRNQLVWEGVLVGRVTQKTREKLQQTVDAAIGEVFQEYPYVAGSSQPAREGEALSGR